MWGHQNINVPGGTPSKNLYRQVQSPNGVVSLAFATPNHIREGGGGGGE